MRALRWLLLALLLGAGALFAIDRASTERLPDLAVRPPAATPPAPPPTLSKVNLQLAIALPALQALIDREVPRQFSGSVDDPTGLLAGSALRWQLARGPVTLSATPDGRLAFSAPIIEGSAVLAGRSTAESAGRGLFGAVQAALGAPVEQRVALSGTLSGTLAPQLRPDWTVAPNLMLDVRLDRAEAALFGVPLRANLAAEAEAVIAANLARVTAALDDQLRADQRLRLAAARGWAQLAGAHALAAAPPAWLALSPQSIAISPPLVSADALNLSLVAEVRAVAQLGGSAPQPVAPPLPPLGEAVATPGAFRVALPVRVRLADLAAVAGAPREVMVGNRRISFSNITLAGAGGAVIIAADVEAAGRWPGRLQGRVYVSARPVLDLARGELRFTELGYTVTTRNLLARSASYLLSPLVLQALRRHAVFAIPGGRAGLIAAANARLAPLSAALPAGISSSVRLDTLDAADLAIDQGWLAITLTASGPAALRVESTNALAAR